MAWQLEGRLIEACSCKIACPCVLGPAEPDQGWCSGALTFAIDRGQSGDVDLSGRTVVLRIDLPKDFAGGDGTARLYIDDGAADNQLTELEDIFQGRKEGPGAVLSSLVSQWLSTEAAPIRIEGGDAPAVTVGDIGSVKLDPIKNEAGQATSVMNAPILGLIAIDRADLARSEGSQFSGNDMRNWESGGHGSVSPFSWQA